MGQNGERMSGTNDKLPSLDLIFDLARDKLHFQSEQWNAIDQKNAIVLAVYGIILAIFSGADASVFTEFRTLILAAWCSGFTEHCDGNMETQWHPNRQ